LQLPQLLSLPPSLSPYSSSIASENHWFYEFLSMTRLLTVNEEMIGRVRILVDDVQVQDVGLV